MRRYRYECKRRPTNPSAFAVEEVRASGTVEAETIEDAWKYVKARLFLTGIWDCELRHGRRGFVSQSFEVKSG